MKRVWKPDARRRGESTERWRARQVRENAAEVRRRLETPVVTGAAHAPPAIPDGEVPWEDGSGAAGLVAVRAGLWDRIQAWADVTCTRTVIATVFASALIMAALTGATILLVKVWWG